MKYALALVALTLIAAAVFIVAPEPIPAKCRSHAAGTCIPGLCKTCSSENDRCCCITTQHCKCVDPTCARMPDAKK